MRNDRFARRQGQRINPQGWPTGFKPGGHLPIGGDRSTPGHHHFAAEYRRKLRGIEVAQFAGTTEVFRQTQGQPRTAGQQRQIGAGGTEGVQIAVRQGIGDCHTDTLSPQFGNFRTHLFGPLGNCVVAQQTDIQASLRLQHPNQIGIGHRRQRVMLHARLAEQLILHKQVATKDRPAILRECRAGQGEVATQCGQQRFADLADIAGRGGVEGRAILEKNLLAALFAQPGQRGEGLLDCFGDRRGTRLQGNDDRIGIKPGRHFRARDANALHGAHTAAHQHVGKVRGAGEIVGDAAQQRACGGGSHGVFLKQAQAWQSAIRCPGKS
ncbi:hypothetical protein D3C71_1083820 [compost metagenome]